MAYLLLIWMCLRDMAIPIMGAITNKGFLSFILCPSEEVRITPGTISSPRVGSGASSPLPGPNAISAGRTASREVANNPDSSPKG